jgi:hypothetical protein
MSEKRFCPKCKILIGRNQYDQFNFHTCNTKTVPLESEISRLNYRIQELQTKNKSLIDDIKEFNTGWEAAQKKQPFDDEKTDCWQQGWEIFDYRRIQSANEKLKEFARKVISWECWEWGDLDAGSVQDLAEKLGLIKPAIATAEDVGDPEFAYFDIGDTIYRFTEALKETEKGKDEE